MSRRAGPDDAPVRVQIAMATLGMLDHACMGPRPELDDVERASENATRRAAYEVLRNYLRGAEAPQVATVAVIDLRQPATRKRPTKARRSRRRA